MRLSSSRFCAPHASRYIHHIVIQISGSIRRLVVSFPHKPHLTGVTNFNHLMISFSQPLSDDLAVAFVLFNSDRVTAGVGRGGERGSGAGETGPGIVSFRLL
jgi:hypothetical protein